MSDAVLILAVYALGLVALLVAVTRQPRSH